jgi:hypothetical protein
VEVDWCELWWDLDAEEMVESGFRGGGGGERCNRQSRPSETTVGGTLNYCPLFSTPNCYLQSCKFHMLQTFYYCLFRVSIVKFPQYGKIETSNNNLLNLLQGSRAIGALSEGKNI